MENNPFLKAAEELLTKKNSRLCKIEESILKSSPDLDNIISDFNLESNDESVADKNSAIIINKENRLISTKYRQRIILKNKKNLEKKNLMFNPKYKSHFKLNEILNHEEDEETEYKEYFLTNSKEENNNLFDFNDVKNKHITYNKENHKRPHEKTNDHFDKDFIIKKTVCSFLNRSGGRIYFGISDIKKVIGINIPHFEKDQAQLRIFNLISSFWPSANINHLKIVFYPIKNTEDKFIKDLYIVKLIVKKGDPYKLYSIQKDSFKSFIRSNNQCINLSAENILKEIIERNEKMKFLKDISLSHNKDINKRDLLSSSEFILDDIEPDVPKEEEYEVLTKNILSKNYKVNEDKSRNDPNNICEKGNKFMKLSSNESKQVYKIQKIPTVLDDLNNEKDDFFSLKRKDKNNFLKNNSLSTLIEKESINKIIITGENCENMKEDIIELLNNKNIKFTRVEISKEIKDPNPFSNKSESPERSFIEIYFEDNQFAKQAYEFLFIFKNKYKKLNVLMM